MKIIKTAALAAAVALVAIQLAPVKRDNPAGPDTFNAPAAVKTIVKRSCYDCHSNETVWPWYTRIAPISWLIAGHVREAREELNFSNWNKLTEKRQNKKREKICDEITEGVMPLPQYVKLHKNARLSEADKKTLCDWAGANEEGK